MYHNSNISNTSLYNSLDYIREFRTQASLYLKEKSEQSLVLLNRCSSLLNTTVQPKVFTPGNEEIAKFFINLHGLIKALDNDSDAMWTCVALLQHCARNLDARQAIIEEYHFVSTLSFILKRTERHDRVHKLLLLLQDLTYGIRITWEETYLGVLIDQLVQIIYTDVEDKSDEANAQLALSILINLCYNNFVVVCLFLRTVNISSFSKRIQNFGMLANKMLIILSEDVHAFDKRELHNFLRSAFAAVDVCWKHWNVPQLRHILDFLLDSQKHAGLHSAMLSYQNYCEDIERLLDQVDARFSMDDSNEETRKHQQLCMGIFFRLIEYVLKLSSEQVEDNKENAISLDAIVPRIYELLCDWIQSNVCGADAVDLLDALLRLAKPEAIAPRIAANPKVITQLIDTTENTSTSSKHTTSILRLLHTLLRHNKTEKLILSKITESYFDKLMKPILSLCPEQINAQMISQSEIEKTVYCLLLLINFASIAKKAYFDKCCALLEQQQLQCALAHALLLSGNDNLAAAVLEINKFQNFPKASMAKHIANISATNLNATKVICEHKSINDQWRIMNATLKDHRQYVSKEIEQRLSALIDIVSTAQENGKLKDVPASQIIELYSSHIETYKSTEFNLQKRLENSSEQITHYMHCNNLQKAELKKYQTINYEMHINHERLQTQCNDLKQQRDKLKCSMTEILKQLAERSEALQVSEKRLAVKSSELISYERQCNEFKTQLESKNEELKKLDASNKENCMRIEKLKKTINAYEHDIKEKMRTLEDKERDLLKTQKLLDDQKEARKKSDDLVSVLEAQLQEKKEQIQSLEYELKETEEMRKTILSLMESKKPKRKA